MANIHTSKIIESFTAHANKLNRDNLSKLKTSGEFKVESRITYCAREFDRKGEVYQQGFADGMRNMSKMGFLITVDITENNNDFGDKFTISIDGWSDTRIPEDGVINTAQSA